MTLKPYAIYVASDRKYGDFLIDHWLRSLRANVDLGKIDIRVLDYGLSTAQRYYLEHEGATVIRCVKDGHVAVVRFRDLANDLRRHDYQQVLAVDGGDIVFQDDIRDVFESSPDQFRAVTEGFSTAFEVFLREPYFSRETMTAIRKTTTLQPQINAGFLVGPRDQFLNLCEAIDRLVLDKRAFGPDQLVVNFFLYQTGFCPLPTGYNFVVATATHEFRIDNGLFRFADSGRMIPVVHNAGNWKVLRPIENFGYGEGHNSLRPEVLSTLHLIHRSTSLLQTTGVRLREYARAAWEKRLAS